MSLIEIIDEREVDRAWVCTAQIIDDQGALQRYDITLTWADYNHWSVDGSATPSAVAEAAIRFLLNRAQADSRPLPARFDASLARRLDPTADSEIPRLIH